LACSKVIVDEDSSIEVRKTMEDSVPYLKDAKKWSHKAFLRKDVSILSYLRETIQLEAEIRQLDNPVEAQDMT
jgi:hypothetical protein